MEGNTPQTGSAEGKLQRLSISNAKFAPMEETLLYRGYDPHFLSNGEICHPVPLPEVGPRHAHDVAPVTGNDRGLLHYLNYTVQLSASRKFPFYAAANIDGALYQKGVRAKSWKKDPRARLFQWGTELYSAEKSDFDKGHMTKREDVQWGESPELAQIAANSTFYYSNAVPQHKELNQQIWKTLEDYILAKETRTGELRICVFTGPVLNDRDPVFISEVRGQRVRLPTLFWKVVVFPKSDGKLYRVGFIMSQRKLIEHFGIVEEVRERAAPDEQLFLQFADAGPYQVDIELIEQLTDLKLPKAIDSYNDERSKRLVLKQVEVDPDHEGTRSAPLLDYEIENLTL
jgi:endonuclease G